MLRGKTGQNKGNLKFTLEPFSGKHRQTEQSSPPQCPIYEP